MRSARFAAGLAAILALLPGCTKPVQDIAIATPVPEIARPSAAPVEPVPAPDTPEPPPAPAPALPPATPAPVEARPPTAAQLQGAYLAAREKSDRIEIVYDLANAGNAEAMGVLTRLFQSEPDIDLKQEMLDAADRIDGQLPAMLTLLGLALGPSQPADVRETALSMLLGIHDRRAIPTWQALLAAPDPDQRELARQQIEDLQQLPPD